MDVNGKDELKTALLQYSNGVAVHDSQPDHIEDDKKIRKLVFKVIGMTCSSCATSIESALGELNGILSVMVSPLQGQAVVKYNPEVINVSKKGRFLLNIFVLFY